eukprot:Clim_evm30s33 gene=Clim_evmTU30s33
MGDQRSWKDIDRVKSTPTGSCAAAYGGSASSTVHGTDVPKYGRSTGSNLTLAERRQREYVLLVSERNRIMKKLKAKEENSSEEKREQGFSMYFNGTNQDQHRQRSSSKKGSSQMAAARQAHRRHPQNIQGFNAHGYTDSVTGTPHHRKQPERKAETPKTAEHGSHRDSAGRNQASIWNQEPEQLGAEQQPQVTRMSKTPRRKWSVDSLEIAQHDTDKRIHISAHNRKCTSRAPTGATVSLGDRPDPYEEECYDDVNNAESEQRQEPGQAQNSRVQAKPLLPILPRTSSLGGSSPGSGSTWTTPLITARSQLSIGLQHHELSLSGFFPDVKEITLDITRNWGDPYYVGLNGIQVLGLNGDIVPLDPMYHVSSLPRDLNDIPGCTGDYRTSDKLLDGVNSTCDDFHMWLIPFTPGTRHRIWLHLPHAMAVTGLRLWNYNKCMDDTYRGVKRLIVHCDERIASPADGFLIRKAPGHALFDFGQEFHFSSRARAPRVSLEATPSIPSTQSQQQAQYCSPIDTSQSNLPTMEQSAIDDRRPTLDTHKRVPSQISTRHVVHHGRAEEDDTGPLRTLSTVSIAEEVYEPPILPSGFIITFRLLNAWADNHYIGLNGIDLYDETGEKIPITMEHVTVVPRGVCDLPNQKHDIRKPENLFDGTNTTYNERHMWLAPCASALKRPNRNATGKGNGSKRSPNLIIIHFPEPVTLSRIKFYNYSRTPSRGVKSFEILVDDILVYQGMLRQAPLQQEENHALSSTRNWGQSVLFTDDEAILKQEWDSLYHWESEQDVQFTDNGKVVQGFTHNEPHGLPFDVDPGHRPTTGIVR